MLFYWVFHPAVQNVNMDLFFVFQAWGILYFLPMYVDTYMCVCNGDKCIGSYVTGL